MYEIGENWLEDRFSRFSPRQTEAEFQPIKYIIFKQSTDADEKEVYYGPFVIAEYTLKSGGKFRTPIRVDSLTKIERFLQPITSKKELTIAALLGF
jgi:hypothetical protein